MTRRRVIASNVTGPTKRVAVGEHKKTTVAQQEVITKQVEKLEHQVLDTE